MSDVYKICIFIHYLTTKPTLMFLELAHTKPDIFIASKSFTLECYKISKLLPQEERFAMTQQIRRAALSVHLNVAEGCSRKSVAGRKRFYEIARGSLIEVDTAIGIAFDLKYFSKETLTTLGGHIINTFKQLTGMIGRNNKS
jgi:four helix bundle protein